MTVHRLLYRSTCAIDGAPAEVDAEVVRIVEAARVLNQRAGVTGALLSVSGVFVQALEGPLRAIESTFERICGDARHRHVQLVDLVAAESRFFEDWSMAAIAPRGDLLRFCATIDAVRGTRVDPASAGAAVTLMRAMIMGGPSTGGAEPAASTAGARAPG
jgi:hypothetical protein